MPFCGRGVVSCGQMDGHDEPNRRFSRFCEKRLKITQLNLPLKRIAVCSQIHTEHINTLCGQNVDLLNVKLAVHTVTTGL